MKILMVLRCCENIILRIVEFFNVNFDDLIINFDHSQAKFDNFQTENEILGPFSHFHGHPWIAADFWTEYPIVPKVKIADLDTEIWKMEMENLIFL